MYQCWFAGGGFLWFRCKACCHGLGFLVLGCHSTPRRGAHSTARSFVPVCSPGQMLRQVAMGGRDGSDVVSGGFGRGGRRQASSKVDVTTWRYYRYRWSIAPMQMYSIYGNKPTANKNGANKNGANKQGEHRPIASCYM